LFTLLGNIYNVENIINNVRQNVNLSRSVYVKSSRLKEQIFTFAAHEFLILNERFDSKDNFTYFINKAFLLCLTIFISFELQRIYCSLKKKLIFGKF
jgi:hypothetical protein